MPELVQFKSAKTLADESLATALTGLVEAAKAGQIRRMVCVCVGDDQLVYKVMHHAADLSLIGALSIVLSDLKANAWRSGPW